MLHSDKDERRPSDVTERKYSTTANDISQGFQAAMGMLVSPNEQDDQESIKKRHSSICESLKSVRERRMRESVESPRFGHGSRNSSLTKRSSMMPPKDYNDELEMAYTAANIKKIFDKRKRYFSFNQSSNHSIDDSSDRSGLVHENYKQSAGGAGKTPSFAPGFTMKMKKDSKPKQGPIKNQLSQIATKLKDDNFSFRSNSRTSSRNDKKIEMSFYKKWKNKNKYNFGIKKTRKYSDNEQRVQKPLEAKSPKKLAGNLSASSYDSECSSCEERVGKSKLEQHLRNFVIQEENDDTESKKASKRETNTEINGIIESLNETSSHAYDMISPNSKHPSEGSEFTNKLGSSMLGSSIHPMHKSSRADETSPKSNSEKTSQISKGSETKKKKKCRKSKRSRVSNKNLHKFSLDGKSRNEDKIQPILGDTDNGFQNGTGAEKTKEEKEEELLEDEYSQFKGGFKFQLKPDSPKKTRQRST